MVINYSTEFTQVINNASTNPKQLKFYFINIYLKENGFKTVFNFQFKEQT